MVLMENENSKVQSKLTELRKQAENKLQPEIKILSTLSKEETDKLVHELRGHQIDLEMQNDELRTTQLALEKVKDEYFDLYNFAPVGYLVLNEKGLIANANLTCVTMLGVEKSMLRNLGFSNFIDKESQDTFYLHRKQLIETQTKQTCELQLVRKDQTRFWAQLECKGIFNDQGDIIQFNANLVDITERKQAEASIRKLSNAVEQSPSTVVITDVSGMIEYVNPKFEQLTGYKREEVLGKNPSILQSGEQSTEFYQELWNAIKAGKEWQGVFHNKKKNGELYWESATIAPIKDNNGNLINYLAVKKDITEQRQAEDQLKASLKEKETLLHEIHHRVKNNMTVISSLLKLQMNNVDNQIAREALKDSQNRVQSMAIVHETLYRSDKLSAINLKTYISELGRTIFQNYSISNKVQLIVEAENIMISVKLASPFGLIINELISNSMKYAFPDDRTGEITVCMKKIDNELELAVTDDGVGIPKDLDWKNSNTLGLKLVRTLVENQLDGSIAMENNNGTKFTIKFNTET